MSQTHNIDTLIIGAGHAGLAMSHILTENRIEHVVLERGEVANSWRNERWDSLKLLTPNWQSRLPGYQYQGEDMNGFMSMQEVIGFLEEYADQSNIPVQTSTTVTRVSSVEGGYLVETDRGNWNCRALVLASGACNKPSIPALSNSLPADISQLHAQDYLNPGQLPQGGVLVVGASATGLQLADEIRSTGREVTLAVGEHVRLPRTYRGKDIQFWMDAAGILDEDESVIDDLTRARHLPSPQLVGSHQQQILDLNAMTSKGIKLAGRLMAVRNDCVQFSGSLKNVCSLADLKMNRLLNNVDEWIANEAFECEPAERFLDTHVDDVPTLAINLNHSDIRTVIWATGYRPDYSWLDVDVLDRKGLLRHHGGACEAPGLYALGLPFLRTRKSTFIHGIEDDALHVASHLRGFLQQQEQVHHVYSNG